MPVLSSAVVFNNPEYQPKFTLPFPVSFPPAPVPIATFAVAPVDGPLLLPSI